MNACGPPGLLTALAEGRIAAAGLDVHEEEPTPLAYPNRDCERASGSGEG